VIIWHFIIFLHFSFFFFFFFFFCPFRKKKQIETLKSFNQVVKEIQRDTVFEVPVTGTNILLSV